MIRASMFSGGLFALVTQACATQSTAAEYSSVRELAQTRAQLELPATAPAVGRDELESEVRVLVRRPLTATTAVRIALLNNHDLRAELQSMGIARGELVQATVLPNPEFEVAMRVPERSGEDLQWDLAAGVDLTDIILRGARADVAEAELEANRYRLASAVLDLAFRVRLGFYDVLATQQRLELLRAALRAFAGGYDTARAMHEAGNITDLDVVTEQAAYEAARVAVAEAEASLLDTRERLNVLLGLHGQETAWNVEERLPDVPTDPPDHNNLEGRAIEASLSLAETRSRLAALSGRVGLARNTGWMPDLTVGVGAEFEDSEWKVGPQISGTLPLFNRQQGSALGQQARFNQLRERYVATAVEIRAAARAGRDRVLSARERARHYREVLLPLRRRVLEQTVLQYNAMQVGVFQLLQARRDELEAARRYIDTLREYWSSAAELEQLLAGRLTQSFAARAESADAENLPDVSSAGH